MRNSRLIQEMIRYYQGDPKRIQHFIKVYTFARTIGELEKVPEKTQKRLETAAIVHDIGIKVSVEKYGSSAGRYQEAEGPAIAGQMLQKLGYEREETERVCYLVGHHHTYTNIDGLDYQILVEADFLVNMYEEQMSEETIRKTVDRIFVTKTGRELAESMFLKEKE